MRELERDLPATPAAPAAPALPGGLTIVGSGRTGGALARAARLAGTPVELLGRGQAPPAEAEVILLCVPDAAITEACELVLRSLRLGALIGHVSGASTLAALDPAARAGHPTFSIHPLQTIPDAETDLSGAPCAVAASDTDALARAHGLAAGLGMLPFDLPEEGRAAYHAAASIASNFLITLEESAATLMAAAGVTDPRVVLAPLVLRSASNWSEDGLAALTGPIARGDEATVARHRAALQDLAPELEPLYDALAERTRSIAGTLRA